MPRGRCRPLRPSRSSPPLLPGRLVAPQWVAAQRRTTCWPRPLLLPRPKAAARRCDSPGDCTIAPAPCISFETAFHDTGATLSAFRRSNLILLPLLRAARCVVALRMSHVCSRPMLPSPRVLETCPAGCSCGGCRPARQPLLRVLGGMPGGEGGSRGISRIMCPLCWPCGRLGNGGAAEAGQNGNRSEGKAAGCHCTAHNATEALALADVCAQSNMVVAAAV